MIIIPPRWMYLVGAALMIVAGVVSLAVVAQTIEPIEGLLIVSAVCAFQIAYFAWKAAKVHVEAIPFSLGRMLRAFIDRTP